MKYLYLLLVIIPNLVLAQTSAQIHYEYFSNSRYKTSSTLLIKDGSYWYSRHQESATIESEEGYTFYYYKDHKDWYYDDATKTITEVWKKSEHPPFYGQWKPNMKWEITQETKEIGEFEVQKATTTPLVHGMDLNPNRTAIAWFTTDIPISAGPEGYYGLPGLILELQYEGEDPDDASKTMIFGTHRAVLKRIEYKPIEKWNVPDSVGKIKIEQEQFGDITKINKKWLKQQKKLLKSTKK